MPQSTWDPFDGLSDAQVEQLSAYESLLEQFNRRVNLVSPESAQRMWNEHIRHSLCLTRRSFPAGSSIVDWGTGGGLPAIPLAIAFPDITVYAVDSVGKKVRAVRTFARRLELENVFAWNGRAEEWTGSAHFSVSRATAPLADLWSWHERIVAPIDADSSDHWPPGLICLKGGDLSVEIQELHHEADGVAVVEEGIYPLLKNDHFREKKIVAVTRPPSPSGDQ
ncbi:16S rRNA (guanine(527)-N(7))-methyltransferase RsmG [Longibacter salinarum]|uniref:Ribosomal RNA small subunit methyltransferase G n=1 Tax=Longibacter salinarum TaxID=1850348 RepID=A0A2A8CVR0_9BACT|nr:16S rRNA (guanine(527)-N(7))-methyltransferase RsmG [Longibacter salinarum]PEN12335.1 16S rRNA (guanine(527)-N(7))-methyltransferase RsmG [Longibacter salinarum]